MIKKEVMNMRITKPEMINRIKPAMEEYFGEKVAKVQLAEDFKYLDVLLETVAAELQPGESCKLGHVTIAVKHVEAKSGIALGKEWSKEAHDKVIVTIDDALKTFKA